MNTSEETPKSFKTASTYRSEKAVRQNKTLSSIIMEQAYLKNENRPQADSIETALKLFDSESGFLNRSDINNSIHLMSDFEFQNSRQEFNTTNTKEPKIALTEISEKAIESLEDITTNNDQDSSACSYDEFKEQKELEYSNSNLHLLRNSRGLITQMLYCESETLTFKYDNNDQLYEFTYADLTWRKDYASSFWKSKDRQTEYQIEGTISVLEPGIIEISKSDTKRTLKMNGARVDEHLTGSITESRKLKNNSSPYDLLAKAKPTSSLWLSNQCFETNSINNSSQGLIPSIAETKAITNEPNKNAYLETPEGQAEIIANKQLNLKQLKQSGLQKHLSKAELKIPFICKVEENILKFILKIFEQYQGNESVKLLNLLDKLSALLMKTYRHDEAELALHRALRIRQIHYGANQAELAKNIFLLAELANNRSNFKVAEDLYKQSLDCFEKGLRKKYFLYLENVVSSTKLELQLLDVLICMEKLFILFSEQNKFESALKIADRAEVVFSEIIEPAVQSNKSTSELNKLKIDNLLAQIQNIRNLSKSISTNNIWH